MKHKKLNDVTRAGDAKAHRWYYQATELEFFPIAVGRPAHWTCTFRDHDIDFAMAVLDRRETEIGLRMKDDGKVYLVHWRRIFWEGGVIKVECVGVGDPPSRLLESEEMGAAENKPCEAPVVATGGACIVSNYFSVLEKSSQPLLRRVIRYPVYASEHISTVIDGVLKLVSDDFDVVFKFNDREVLARRGDTREGLLDRYQNVASAGTA